MKMDHLPAKGETVTDAEYMQVFGGKGANQAVEQPAPEATWLL